MGPPGDHARWAVKDMNLEFLLSYLQYQECIQEYNPK